MLRTSAQTCVFAGLPAELKWFTIQSQSSDGDVGWSQVKGSKPVLVMLRTSAQTCVFAGLLTELKWFTIQSQSSDEDVGWSEVKTSLFINLLSIFHILLNNEYRITNIEVRSYFHSFYSLMKWFADYFQSSDGDVGWSQTKKLHSLYP